MKRGDTADALEKVNTSLQFNASNPLAMGLKALALANSGRKKAAQAYIVLSRTIPIELSAALRALDD
jgi:hypothetical protein